MRTARVVTPAGRPNSDINVTPLVDVVLVLLIIFMVVTPLLEKDINVRVPQSEVVEDVQQVPQDQLVVRLGADGELTINLQKVDKDHLVEELRKILERKKEDDKLVFVTSDEKANYGTLITVLDKAKQAGAAILGMMTDPMETQQPAQPGSPPPPDTQPPSPGGSASAPGSH